MNNEDNALSSLRDVRYSALVSLWTHHNQTQLQWPTVIIGASLIVIAGIAPSHITDLFNIRLWPRQLDLIFGIGFALLLTGLGVLAMVYTMLRARQIMIALEREIDRIESGLNVESRFGSLNHPNSLNSYSGAKLLRNCMLIFLALPMTLLGMWLILGWVLGTLAECGLLLFSLHVWRLSK